MFASKYITLDEQAAGRLYAVPTQSNYQICVSSPEQINEINNASEDQLSLNAALTDVSSRPTFLSCTLVNSVENAFLVYTVHGFKHEKSDPHNKASVVALKARLRAHLPALRPSLQKILEDAFSDVNTQEKNLDGVFSFIQFLFRTLTRNLLNRMDKCFSLLDG